MMMTLSNEIWKSAPGWPNYEVSCEGRVRRKKTGRLLSLRENSCGYLRAGVSDKGLRKEILVHRLVAAAFIGPCPKGLQVNHIDEDKTNNRVNNLEYVTPKENCKHGTHMERIAKKLGKPVLQMNDAGEILAKFSSAREAARITGADYRHISACCLGKLQHHRGYIWKYAEETR